MLCLSSCFKKDDAIVLPLGTTEISSCFMGDNYEKQMYFDLSSNTFIEKQLVDWDISFESSDNGFGVFINTGYNIKVRKANIYNLNETLVRDTTYIKQQSELVDGSDGKISSSAIGDWRSYKINDGSGGYIYGIYFIELSYLTGTDRFRRLQIIGVSDSVYAIKITKLDEFNAPITLIHKNKMQNFTFYSFKNGGGVVDNVEPPKTMWDIEFTKYKTVIPNPPTTILYSVLGVFSNRNNVTVGIDSTSKFEDIDAKYISNYNFSTNKDAIGYEWKTFDRTSYVYTVNSNITFIIKDTDGDYYKMRFLDYYDKFRVKGNPKFEFIRIK